jgi:hypothetical protein
MAFGAVLRGDHDESRVLEHEPGHQRGDLRIGRGQWLTVERHGKFVELDGVHFELRRVDLEHFLRR